MAQTSARARAHVPCQALALRALGVLAELCASHGRTCYGIELLNEPAGTQGPSYLQAGDLDRRALLDFYKLAIQEVRQHVPQDRRAHACLPRARQCVRTRRRIQGGTHDG